MEGGEGRPLLHLRAGVGVEEGVVGVVVWAGQQQGGGGVPPQPSMATQSSRWPH